MIIFLHLLEVIKRLRLLSLRIIICFICFHRSRKSVCSDVARGGKNSLDMVHNNRVCSTRVWYAGTQYPHVHLQIMEEATVKALCPGFHHGDVSCRRPSSDVFGCTA